MNIKNLGPKVVAVYYPNGIDIAYTAYLAHTDIEGNYYLFDNHTKRENAWKVAPDRCNFAEDIDYRTDFLLSV